MELEAVMTSAVICNTYLVDCEVPLLTLTHIRTLGACDECVLSVSLTFLLSKTRVIFISQGGSVFSLL